MYSQIRAWALLPWLTILAAGCGGTAPSSAGDKTATGGDPYPTFKEGGTLSLTVQGQPVTVPIGSVFLTNTDSGYPDFLEISGPGTFLCALIDPKMQGGDGEAYYKPVLGRSLPFNVPLDLQPTPREITIPNQGKYPVTGGSATIEKAQIGMDGRDMCEGRIEVTVQTSQGPATASGTFSFCVVPTW